MGGGLPFSGFERTVVLVDLKMLEIEGESPGALLADPKRADLHDELIPGVTGKYSRVLQRLSLGIPEPQVAESASCFKIGGPPCARFQIGNEPLSDLILAKIRRAQVGLRILGDNLQSLCFNRCHPRGNFGRRHEAKIQDVAFRICQI